MLCPSCGTFSDQNATVCLKCGRLLPRGESMDLGVQAIRQGKKAREDAAAGRMPSMEAQRQGHAASEPVQTRAEDEYPVYSDPDVYDEQGRPFSSTPERRRPENIGRSGTRAPKLRRDQHPVHQRQVNWAAVTVGAVLTVIMLLAGTAVFLMRTYSGQLIMARLGRSSNSAALWEVGAEKMDVGDIDGAIEYFLLAYDLDGKDNVNVPGLLQLGSAYEAAGRLDEAEKLYTNIFTNIVPSATDAYTNLIRILLAEERNPEAAELMQLAYTKTGSATFQSQRNALLPQPPTVSPLAGYYEEVKTVSLISPQGYDIYYTFDENAVLPADGVKFETPLRLDENTWPLRAVCVNEDLVSDEFSATFRISMPSPASPYPSLAPNTYKQRQKLRLYQNIERDNDPNITIYYTIDGSTPDADSPIFTGEAFWLPAGYVTLKAVSVNEYGKASNTLEVKYKLESGPVPLQSYSVEDTANGLRLNGTLYGDFVATYGETDHVEEISRSGFDGILRKYTYSWGHAIFHTHKGSATLVELFFTTDQFKAPRSTGIGDTLDKVVGKYRDMIQVESPSGNRGLYSNNSGSGKIYVNGNGTNRVEESQIIYPTYPVDAKIIRYLANTADSHEWQLDYIVVNNRVTAVNMVFLP